LATSFTRGIAGRFRYRLTFYLISAVGKTSVHCISGKLKIQPMGVAHGRQDAPQWELFCDDARKNTSKSWA
jgi:hypothetical protein